MIRILLFLAGLLVVLVGIFVTMGSPILPTGPIFILIGVNLIVGAVIVEAINELARVMRKSREQDETWALV